MSRSRPVRLLCTGDLHLGRYPTRIRSNDDHLSVTSIWSRIVDHAVSQALDAVVLTGDVVDEGNKHFEAYGPLKSGLASLAQASIPVFAVAGNHDFDVLPRLHRELGNDTFHLLGADGAWQTEALTRDGHPVLYVCGWSFDRSHVTESPVNTFECPELETEQAIPVLGVLHADLDGAERKYAPVRLAELNDIPVAAWLLGHIHKPSLHSHRDGFVLYPGSPQPLSTGETGAHGPWMIEVSPSGAVTARHLPMASLAYEPLHVDLTGVDSEAEFRSLVLTRIEEEAKSLSAERPDLHTVLFSAVYDGRTPLHRRVRALDEQVREEIPASGLRTRIVRSVLSVRPAIDMDALSKGRDPVGVLARLVQDLDGHGNAASGGGSPSVALEQLVADVRQTAGELHRKPAFTPLREQRTGFDAPTDETLIPIIREQALALIEVMLEQKPSDGKE
ncbi:MAG: DNA repair exonuclease [Rhodothermales bacterium]|nr:DNA repair exonuclease [Rhodothermales bacterium]